MRFTRPMALLVCVLSSSGAFAGDPAPERKPPPATDAAPDEAPAHGAAAPEVQQRIAALIGQLDAADFAAREQAKRELIGIGQAALPAVQQILAENPPAEVRRRALQIVQAIEQAILHENPVRLEALIRLALPPEGEAPAQAERRAATFDQELGRLLEILGGAAGKGRLKRPARLAELPRGDPSSIVRRQFVVLKSNDRISIAQDSVIVAENGGSLSLVSQCIVVAPFGVRISSVRDSIVLEAVEDEGAGSGPL